MVFKKIVIIFCIILLSFLSGAWLHKKERYPFGPTGIYTSFKVLKKELNKEEVEVSYEEAYEQKILNTRIRDFKVFPLMRAKNLLKSPLFAKNILASLYTDLDYRMNLDSDFCPPLEKQDGFFSVFTEYQRSCIRIYYEHHSFDTYAVLLKSNKKNIGLTIYNHGHGAGLPTKEELFAINLIRGLLERGHDVLITSLPFLGLNYPMGKFMLTTLDGPTVVDYPSPRHEVFETLDVGASNYMRFFIDSAVLPTIGWLDHYKNINYVGLSGGATVGLPACVLLKNVIKNCILVAGIMPLDLRVKYPEYILGDAEQITQSFHRIASVREMIAELKREKSNLVLMYNDEDPCCFQKKEALDFKNSLGTEAPPFFIRHASAHEYDPEQILDILQ